jgi:hypothetical protein
VPRRPGRDQRGAREYRSQPGARHGQAQKAMCVAAWRCTQLGTRAWSTRTMCPHHPIPFTRSPVCPCRREAGSGAACGEGAQNRRGAARLDAVTVRAETLKGRVLLCGGFVRPASLFGGFVNIGGRIRPSGHLKA